MDDKTLEALKGSINKWERIVEGTSIDLGTTNCPLCQLFFRNRCTGCPVSEEVSNVECRDTPYEDYGDIPSIKNAQYELDFLKSLLPEE